MGRNGTGEVHFILMDIRNNHRKKGIGPVYFRFCSNAYNYSSYIEASDSLGKSKSPTPIPYQYIEEQTINQASKRLIN